MSTETGSAGMAADADIVRGAKTNEGAAVKNFYKVECIGPDGKLKWVENFGNLVVDEGLDLLLTNNFKASGYTAAWYVGLTNTNPSTDPTDTLASKAWTEITDYDEATREALVLGAVASESVDNSASKASFAINASVTVGGAFVCSVSTKGDTGAGLYSVGAFAGGDKVLGIGDTLNVQVTLTTSAA